MASAWALLGAFAPVGVFGDLMKLPRSVQEISPYAHTPDLPGGVVQLPSLMALGLVAAGAGAE